jgi:Ni,Fe-hydrogenase III large subunit
MSARVHAADWQERESEDHFGIQFEGHPRLGDFVLHNEEWGEGLAPMRTHFDGRQGQTHRQPDPDWHPRRILHTPGAFAMTVGPVYGGLAEPVHFLLETVGEDVVRAYPRLFYKYRAVEKMAEGGEVSDVLLLAERFNATQAFAHSFAFCQAVEKIAGLELSPRAQGLRVALAELERLRSHVGAIRGICGSTGLAVAESQAAILEEDLLRLCGSFSGHRYLFGLNVPGGLCRDFSDEACRALQERLDGLDSALRDLNRMLSQSSSFLDRLEEVGIVTLQQAVDHGLVGPVARASGLVCDLRAAHSYSGYERYSLEVPHEEDGDGYARLRVLFFEAEQSVRLIRQVMNTLPQGAVRERFQPASVPGSAFGWVEAAGGAALHWVWLDDEGRVSRYRVIPPSFVNWHGFHLAAEGFAFQDFPIILATFALSVAENDR